MNITQLPPGARIERLPPFAPKTEEKTRVLLNAGPAALADKHWRKLIASFQEVAWTERKERWENLRGRVTDRYLMWWRCSAICASHALAWRRWGKTTK